MRKAIRGSWLVRNALSLSLGGLLNANTGCTKNGHHAAIMSHSFYYVNFFPKRDEMGIYLKLFGFLSHFGSNIWTFIPFIHRNYLYFTCSFPMPIIYQLWKSLQNQGFSTDLEASNA